MASNKEKERLRWILKLNPKGQATIPVEVCRALGVGSDRSELELVLDENGYRLRPHKDAIPVEQYIGYCAEELKDVEDTLAFLRKLRGLDYPNAEE